LNQTEDSNGWASIAQTDDMNGIPKYVPKKKPEPPKGEEWPSIGPSKESTADARPAASSGWSNIVNKSTPKSTATSTPTTASPSRPATPTVGAEQWPAVNPSAEKKTSKWPSVSKSPAPTKVAGNSWSAMATKTTESPKDNWASPPVQDKPSDDGWSAPASQEKSSNGGWSSSAQEKSSNSGWSTPPASNANKSTNQGWSSATQSANDSWSTPPAEPITIDLTAQTNAEPAQTDGWTTSAPAKPTNESWSNKPSESTQTGWSTSAPAAAEPKKSNWSKPSTDVANSSWTTNPAELDKEWSPQVTENTTSAWSSSKKPRETSSSGCPSTLASETNNSSWGAKVKTNRWATKNDSSENLGGWGAISNASSTAGRNNNSNNAWDQNEPTATVPTSWDPTPSGTSEWENRSNSDNWRQKNDQNKATNSDKNSNGKWANSQLPWDNVSSTPTEEPQQQQSTPPPPPSIPQDNSNNGAIMNRPPGLPMNEAPASSIISSNATITAPPPQSTPFVMATEPAPFATPSPASVPDPLQTAAIAMLSAAQLQAPLPPNLDELGSDNLILLARNLYNQNSQLIQTVYSMQSETTMMTRRYTDIITLTREKEQQTIQLLEARRQTDLEEARRYVLGLEARIKQLEQTKTTASFGNHDLFTGHHDEMGGRPQQNRRKMWSKHHSLRCGNCGQEGHASNDCTVSICN
jgi:hypothetical protein